MPLGRKVECRYYAEYCFGSEGRVGAVFRSNDAPRYIKAFIAHIVVYGVQLVAIVFLRLRLMRQNVLKRRAQAIAPSKSSGEDSVGTASTEAGIQSLTKRYTGRESLTPTCF